MAEEKIARIAREIYENVGGTQNVKKLILCMTRVRMTIIDDSKVNLAGLKAIDGVMGVVEDETLQVVIGPGTVNKVAQAMVETVGSRILLVSCCLELIASLYQLLVILRNLKPVLFKNIHINKHSV